MLLIEHVNHAPLHNPAETHYLFLGYKLQQFNSFTRKFYVLFLIIFPQRTQQYLLS